MQSSKPSLFSIVSLKKDAGFLGLFFSQFITISYQTSCPENLFLRECDSCLCYPIRAYIALQEFHVRCLRHA